MTSAHGATLARLGWLTSLPELLRRPPDRPRAGIVALAAGLFVAIFVLRLAVANAGDPVLILNAVPIALLSLEAGKKGGLAGATIGVASVGLWSVIANVDLSVIGYLTRVLTFFLVGVLAGQLVERLRQAREAQKLLLELAPESAFALDLDGHVTIANSAAQNLFGYGADELTGQPVERLVPEFFEAVRWSLRQRKDLEEALLLTAWSKDGSKVRVRATVEPLASDAGVLLVRVQPAGALPT
jgi:PAS domain S-box-containing protein